MKRFLTVGFLLLITMSFWMRGWWNANLPLTPREENISQLTHIWRLNQAARQGWLWSAWNPLDNAGAPNLIQRSYLVFAPLAQITHSFNISVNTIYKTAALFAFILSGLGMYQLLLTLKLSRSASFTGALAYMLSPPHITLASDLLDFNFYWSLVPWLVYLVERFLVRGQPLFHGALLGLFLTAAYITGNTYFVTTFPFLCLYAFMRLCFNRTSLKFSFKFAFFSLGFFLTTSAFVVLPALIEFPHLRLSQEIIRKQIIDLPQFIDLVRLFIWRWQGHSPLAWDINSRYPDLSWYFGTTVVILSLIAILNFKKFWLHLFPGLILILALIPFFIVMHWPPAKTLALRFLDVFPTFQAVFDRTYRLFLIPSFLLALFSAFGAQILIHRFSRQTKLITFLIISLIIIDFSPLSQFFFTLPLEKFQPSSAIIEELNNSQPLTRLWEPFPYFPHLPKYKFEYASGQVHKPQIRSEYSYAALSPRYTSSIFEAALFGALETNGQSPEKILSLLNLGAVEYILLAKPVFNYQPFVNYLVDKSWQITIEDEIYFLLRYPQPPNLIQGKNALITLTRPAPELITAQVNASQSTLVSVSESWYPGWQVAVDNQPAALLRANSAFLGTIVPAGNHLINFTYHQPSYYSLGKFISFISLIILISSYVSYLL